MTATPFYRNAIPDGDNQATAVSRFSHKPQHNVNAGRPSLPCGSGRITPIRRYVKIRGMTQPKYRNIAIIGVGLIGGSIGLAARKSGLAESVIGIGRRESSLAKAEKVGAVTATTTDIATGVAEADLIVACTPVALIVDHISQAAVACPSGTLITDAGSTKQDIVSRLAEADLPSGTRFIGSHPLAGSHQTGPEAATADLFENHHVVLTPTDQTDPQATTEATAFWQALGATVSQMSPTEHDAALAITSHLPHIVAAALAGTTPIENLNLTAGGWRDTTRIAAADVDLWSQILQQNSPHTLKALSNFETVLQSFRAALESADESSLRQLLEQGKKHRDALGS